MATFLCVPFRQKRKKMIWTVSAHPEQSWADISILLFYGLYMRVTNKYAAVTRIVRIYYCVAL